MISKTFMNPKIIAIIVGIAIVAIAAVFFFGGKEQLSLLSGFHFAAFAGVNSEEVVSKSENDAPSMETYRNPDYLFSLNHPKGYSVGTFFEGESDVVLFQGQSGGGFQIAITPFDEPGPIDAARIQNDLPKLSVEGPRQVFIGKGKTIEATAFFSSSDSVGRTREVWFVFPENFQPNGNYLYQVTTSADADNVIGPILDTISFE